MKELQDVLQEAILKAVTAKYQDKSMRINVIRLDIEPLHPAGWSLSLHMSAQLSPLDNKIEVEPSEL
jgi:hypothetical protein